MNPIRTHSITHRGQPYEIRAQLDPATSRIDVGMFDGAGDPVVITYPDGLKAVLIHSVELSIRMDMSKVLGVSAVDEMMATAESDLRRLV